MNEITNSMTPGKQADDFPPLPNELAADKHIAKQQKKQEGKKRRHIYRGDVYYADLNPVIGSEQGGKRPVVVVQNDVGNKFSTTVIVTPITSQTNKAKLPTHIQVNLPIHSHHGNHCIALAEQLRTIDKKRLSDRIGKLSKPEMEQLNQALKVSLCLN